MKQLFLVLLIFITFQAQSQTTFSIITGTNEDDNYPSIENCGDDFVVLYNILPTEGSQINHQVSMNRISEDGEVEEVFRFKSDTAMYMIGSVVEHEGYLYCHGLRKHVDSTYYRHWIFKMNEDLSILWQKEYESPFDGFFYQSNMAFFKGNLIISSSNFIGMQRNTHFLKVDLSGNLLLVKLAMQNSHNLVYDILAHENMLENHFYVFGSGFEHIANGSNLRLTMNNDFEIIDEGFTSIYSEQNAEWITDTTFMLCGGWYINDTIYAVSKVIDTSLVIYHEEYFKHNTSSNQHVGVFNGLCNAGNDNYYLGGSTHIDSLFIDYPSYVMLNKLDSDLDVQWQRFYGGDAKYVLYSMRATSDGGCIMVGRRYDWNSKNQVHDIFVMKVNEEGLITATTAPEFTVTEAIVYPNPGSDVIHVQSAFQMEKFQLIDLNGRVILEQNLHGEEATINSSAIKSGVYIYRIIGKNNKIESGKWVKR